MEEKDYSCSYRTLETDAHLWSLKDAKAGDVISSIYGNAFIYNGKLSGTMSFPEFFQKYLSSDVMWEESQRTRNHDEYDAHKHLLMSFLTGTELTLDEYKSLKKHYEDVIDPKDVSYYKEYYDTKGDTMKEEEFLKND